jgi:hypothetical protein
MKKNYIYIVILLLLFSFGAKAQDSKQDAGAKEPIEGLSISPNPASSDRIYITTKLSESKEVDIFDVLGKRVLHATLTGKELNISELTPGVYIIKIKEGEATATRKLIVK